MKKAVFEKFGGLDTIKIIDSKRPQLSANEVLVKVKAVGLNPKDILIRKGKFKRLSGSKFPQTIGFEFSGYIEDPNNHAYTKGDKVFGMINGWKGRCCAEFIKIDINEIYWAPKDRPHEELAGISLAGQTALQAIRNIGSIKEGQHICINGASGGVGTLAIQIAKELGGIVTTISSKTNTSLCASLGADHTLAYDQADILTSDLKFDVFFDVFGNYSFKKVNLLLTSSGKYITTVPKPAIFKEQVFNLFRGKKAKMVVVKSNAKDIKWFAEKIDANRIKPIVDKIFPLEEIKAAQQYIETKRAKGKVIIRMDD